MRTSNNTGKCPICHQDEYHSGEYPCNFCGRPTVWDEKEKVNDE